MAAPGPAGHLTPSRERKRLARRARPRVGIRHLSPHLAELLHALTALPARVSSLALGVGDKVPRLHHGDELAANLAPRSLS